MVELHKHDADADVIQCRGVSEKSIAAPADTKTRPAIRRGHSGKLSAYLALAAQMATCLWHVM